MGLKDEYFATMVSQFKRWDAEFGMLSDKVGAAADAQYDEQLKAMRTNRDAAYRKLQEIRTASESGWRSMQTGMDEAWDSMRNTLDQASARSKKRP